MVISIYSSLFNLGMFLIDQIYDQETVFPGNLKIS
jgi:hypothetical protein